jgi:hypothetical protein
LFSHFPFVYAFVGSIRKNQFLYRWYTDRDAMKRVLIIFGLSLAGMFGVIQLRWTWQAGQNREELAQSWSSDSVQFVAIGPNNRTLFTSLSGMGQAEDDAFLASVAHDGHLANELRGLGFERIQCGARSTALAAERKR